MFTRLSDISKFYEICWLHFSSIFSFCLQNNGKQVSFDHKQAKHNKWNEMLETVAISQLANPVL